MVKSSCPAGWRVYAVLTAVSSLAVLFGLHREFYSLLHRVSLPNLLISSLAGLANLSWFELSYVLGWGLRNATLFTLLPFLGSMVGLISALLILTRFRFRRHVLFAHLTLGVMLAVFSLLFLLWRAYKGFGDPWRLMTTVSFLLTYSFWFIYFHRTRRFFAQR